MSVQAEERVMASERIAPGMLPRVLNSFDMTIIFVAIVLFIVNAAALQPAGQSAFTFWILGFLVFLIPGALVTAQLGQMFPHEGSLYVWTQKALGPFWGFFAGFCAWWPGILVMVATGDAVVTMWQFIDSGSLSQSWQQGLVILVVLWFSAGMSILRLRFTQSYVNFAVVFYGAAVFVIGLSGVLWLIGHGHPATGGWGHASNWGFQSTGSLTLFGLVILALLGIEVPLNMGVEIVHMRADPQIPVLGVDRRHGGLPVGHAGDHAGVERGQESSRHHRPPAAPCRWDSGAPTPSPQWSGSC